MSKQRIYSNGIKQSDFDQYYDRRVSELFAMQNCGVTRLDECGYCLDAPDMFPAGAMFRGQVMQATYMHATFRPEAA